MKHDFFDGDHFWFIDMIGVIQFSGVYVALGLQLFSVWLIIVVFDFSGNDNPVRSLPDRTHDFVISPYIEVCAEYNLPTLTRDIADGLRRGFL